MLNDYAPAWSYLIPWAAWRSQGVLAIYIWLMSAEIFRWYLTWSTSVWLLRVSLSGSALNIKGVLPFSIPPLLCISYNHEKLITNFSWELPHKLFNFGQICPISVPESDGYKCNRCHVRTHPGVFWCKHEFKLHLRSAPPSSASEDNRTFLIHSGLSV